MAPEWPEEVDVFRVPHSRMKELVHKYLDMVTSTNFSDVVHLRSLLKNLCNTFQEFRAHERIENKYIMRKLKGKLRSLSITNTAVCNCHSDNRLSEMLQLVKSGYTWTGKTARERLNYGLQLRKALDEFTEKFLPHMEEEEEVFQPMLIKYFTYEELREIKATVIEHHKARNQAETCEKCVSDAQTSESSDDESEPCIPRATFHSLPDEVVLRVMTYLSPSDLARSAQVCQCWNRLAMDASLWTRLYPVSWSRGDMTFNPTVQPNSDEEPSRMSPQNFLIDEDADIDESESVDDEDSNETDDEDRQYKKAYREWRLLSGLTSGLLSRVGKSVTLVSLSGSTGVTNTLLHQILVSCTNLEYLDVSYTPISDAAFKGLSGQCLKLKHLDLTGCANITDVSLKRLARAMNPEMDVDNECSNCCRADSIDECGVQIALMSVETVATPRTLNADWARGMITTRGKLTTTRV